MKRDSFSILSKFIALILLVAFVSACGADSPKEAVSEKTLNPASENSLKEVTLTFVLLGDEPGRNIKEHITLIEGRSKAAVNAKLNFKWLDNSNYYTDLRRMLAANENCDAFYYTAQPSDYYWTYDAYRLDYMSQEGYLMDISEIFPKAAPKLYSRYTMEELESAKYKDKLYTIPSRMPVSKRRSVLVREDFMQKYSIPDIKSYDDYENYLKVIREKEPELIPLCFEDTTLKMFAEVNGYKILDFQLGLVYRWDDPSMKIMAWEQVPEYRNIVNRFANWQKKGYIVKDASYYYRYLDASVFTSGKFASIITDMGMQNSIDALLKSKGTKWRYKEFPLYTDIISERKPPARYDGIAFNKNSQNIERAIMFLEWIHMNQENYDFVMYGTEGKNYTLFGEQLNFTDNSRYLYEWTGSHIFQNIDYMRTTTASDPNDKKQYMDLIKNKSRFPKDMGFYIKNESLLLEGYVLRTSSFNLIENAISSGIFNERTVDKFIKEQKEQGVDEIVAEVQKQLDKWRKDNNK